MNTKEYLKNNPVHNFGLLIIGIVVGLIVMYLYFQPKLAYQKKMVKEWSNVSSKNQTLASQKQKDIDDYKVQLASASAQIKTLQDRPPQVEYRTQTQYVQTPPRQAQKQPVTYNRSGDVMFGSDGSFCYGGNVMFCNGGH